MTDLDALLANIIANPADDLARLVYADALEERGRPGDADRAKFIRLSIELHRWRGGSRVANRRRDARAARFRDLVDAAQAEWLGVPGGKRYVLAHLGDWWNDSKSGRATTAVHLGGPVEVSITRGFVSAVECDLEQFAGEACPACGGGGQRLTLTGPMHAAESGWAKCRRCDGAGRTGGIAAELFRLQPVERVDLPDLSRLDQEPGLLRKFLTDGQTFNGALVAYGRSLAGITDPQPA